MPSPSPIIFGFASHTLSEEEIRFFQGINPVGFILFRRNIDTPEQLRALTDALRETVGRDDVLILIDQEGGRVARLKPPHWERLPAAALYGKRYEQDPDAGLDAVALHAQITAHMLRTGGIQVNCAPVADLLQRDAHEVIGDRSYSHHISTVIALATQYITTSLAEGIIPVMKHIPGHGRAKSDSHLALPHIATDLAQLEATDFSIFKALAPIAPMAMTAHVVFEALDPGAPATFSPIVIDYIRNHLGFRGLLISDAIEMEALSGSMQSRAFQTLHAGCDIVLHCSGSMAEMHDVAAGIQQWTEAGGTTDWSGLEALLAVITHIGPSADDSKQFIAGRIAASAALESLLESSLESSLDPVASSPTVHPAFEA